MTKIFIDGRAGTTGLQIEGRMGLRDDVTLIELPEAMKKDPAARKDAIQEADYVFLCLPDAAAKEAAAKELEGKTIIKEIVVPGKLVNFVVK